MLTDLGIPLLRWLDETVLPEAIWTLQDFHRYVKRWRDLVDAPEAPW